MAKVFVFTEPWRFVLRIKPNMITKTRVIDIELERREKEIYYYLERGDHWHRLRCLLDGYSNWKEWKFKSKDDRINYIKNKSIEEFLDIIQSEIWEN